MSRVPLGFDKTKLRPQVLLYTALSDGNFDFTWYPHEVTTVINRWNEGSHISDIAEELDRDTDEVAVLIIDLARKGKIGRREGGVYGDTKEEG